MQNRWTNTLNSVFKKIHLRPPNTKEEMEEIIINLRALFSKNIEGYRKMLIEMLPKEPTLSSFLSLTEFEKEQQKYSDYMKIYKEQVIFLLDQMEEMNSYFQLIVKDMSMEFKNIMELLKDGSINEAREYLKTKSELFTQNYEKAMIKLDEQGNKLDEKIKELKNKLEILKKEHCPQDKYYLGDFWWLYGG